MPSELEKNEVRKEQKAQYKKQQERAMKEELREEMQQACYRGRACASDARPLRIAAPAAAAAPAPSSDKWYTGHLKLGVKPNKFRENLFICPICVYGPILLAGGVNMRLRCIKKNKSCAMNAYWGI